MLKLLWTLFETWTCWRRWFRTNSCRTRTQNGPKWLDRTSLTFTRQPVGQDCKQFQIFGCAPEEDSDKDVFNILGTLAVSYLKCAKILSRACATSVPNCLGVIEELSVVRSDTSFRDSSRSVSHTFSFESTSFQFERIVAHTTLAGSIFLLTAFVAPSNDASICLSNESFISNERASFQHQHAHLKPSLKLVIAQLQVL